MEGSEGNGPPSRSYEQRDMGSITERRLESLGQQIPRMAYATEHGQIPHTYAPPALSGTALSYQSEYPTEQSRPATYQTYGPGMEYPTPQSSQASPAYNQYHPRQGPGLEVTTQYGVPTQYYVPNESSNPSPQIPAPPAPPTLPSYHNQYHSGYEQVGSSRTEHSTYSSGTGMSATMSGVPYAHQQQAAHQQQPSDDMDVAFQEYEHSLRQTYQHVRDGRLSLAGRNLLELSTWLLGNAVQFGLVRDEKNLLQHRHRMWNEFNMCWVCLMRKQKELLQEGILATELHPPRDLLPPETLRRMGDELIRLCDSLERHGLVDYQLGVWEEEIIDGIQEALDIMEGRRQRASQSRERQETTQAVVTTPDTSAPNDSYRKESGQSQHQQQHPWTGDASTPTQIPTSMSN